MLTSYHWPGNVRELENVMERAVILARSGRITADTLPIRPETAPSPNTAPGPAPLVSLETMERDHIQRILASTGYHKSRSAEVLGISRKTLDRKIAEYGLTIPRSGAGEP
jgi:DNA-binding NtrC family response regulator